MPEINFGSKVSNASLREMITGITLHIVVRSSLPPKYQLLSKIMTIFQQFRPKFVCRGLIKVMQILF